MGRECLLGVEAGEPRSTKVPRHDEMAACAARTDRGIERWNASLECYTMRCKTILIQIPQLRSPCARVTRVSSHGSGLCADVSDIERA